MTPVEARQVLALYCGETETLVGDNDGKALQKELEDVLLGEYEIWLDSDWFVSASRWLQGYHSLRLPLRRRPR